MAEGETVSTLKGHDLMFTQCNPSQHLEDLRRKEKTLLIELNHKNETIKKLEEDLQQLLDESNQLIEKAGALQKRIEKSKSRKSQRLLEEKLNDLIAMHETDLKPRIKETEVTIDEFIGSKVETQNSLYETVIARRELEAHLGESNEGDLSIPGLEDFPIQGQDWKQSRLSVLKQMNDVGDIEEVTLDIKPSVVRGIVLQTKAMGQKGLAQVYTAKLQVDNRDITLKVIDLAKIDKKYIAHLKSQSSKVLWYVNQAAHDNIVTVYDWFILNGKDLYIAEEFLIYSLKLVIDSVGRLYEKEIRKHAFGLANGLNFLHKSGISHQNVRASNIYIRPDKVVKLASLEYAIICWDSEKDAVILQRPIDDFEAGKFLSPEVSSKLEYDPIKADVFSYGTMIFFMGIGRYPYESTLKEPMGSQWVKAHFELDEALSTWAVDLATKCTNQDPSKRLTMSSVVSHPWFHDIEC